MLVPLLEKVKIGEERGSVFKTLPAPNVVHRPPRCRGAAGDALRGASFTTHRRRWVALKGVAKEDT